jgi:hypothetical protein
VRSHPRKLDARVSRGCDGAPGTLSLAGPRVMVEQVAHRPPAETSGEQRESRASAGARTFFFKRRSAVSADPFTERVFGDAMAFAGSDTIAAIFQRSKCEILPSTCGLSTPGPENWLKQSIAQTAIPKLGHFQCNEPEESDGRTEHDLCLPLLAPSPQSKRSGIARARSLVETDGLVGTPVKPGWHLRRGGSGASRQLGRRCDRKHRQRR